MSAGTLVSFVVQAAPRDVYDPMCICLSISQNKRRNRQVSIPAERPYLKTK